MPWLQRCGTSLLEFHPSDSQSHPHRLAAESAPSSRAPRNRRLAAETLARHGRGDTRAVRGCVVWGSPRPAGPRVALPRHLWGGCCAACCACDAWPEASATGCYDAARPVTLTVQAREASAARLARLHALQRHPTRPVSPRLSKVTVEGSGTTVVVGGNARGDGNDGTGTGAGKESGRGGKAIATGGARSDDGGISPGDGGGGKVGTVGGVASSSGGTSPRVEGGEKGGAAGGATSDDGGISPRAEGGEKGGATGGATSSAGGVSSSGGASAGGDSGGQSTCVEGGSGHAGWSPSEGGGSGASTISNTSLQQYVRGCRTPSVSSVSPFGKSI